MSLNKKTLRLEKVIKGPYLPVQGFGGSVKQWPFITSLTWISTYIFVQNVFHFFLYTDKNINNCVYYLFTQITFWETMFCIPELYLFF